MKGLMLYTYILVLTVGFQLHAGLTNGIESMPSQRLVQKEGQSVKNDDNSLRDREVVAKEARIRLIKARLEALARANMLSQDPRYSYLFTQQPIQREHDMVDGI